MSSYTILICPICREQLSEDPEYGAACERHRENYGPVDAIQVPVAGLKARERDEAILAVMPELAEQRRKHETREAMWDWYRSLPKEERDRMEAERRAALTPMQRATEDAMRAMVADTQRALNREPFNWKGGYTVIPAAGSTEPERSG